MDRRSAKRWLSALELPAVALARMRRDPSYLRSENDETIGRREKLAAEAGLLLVIGLRSFDEDVVDKRLLRFVAEALRDVSTMARPQGLVRHCPQAVTTLALPWIAAADVSRRPWAPGFALGIDPDVRRRLERWLASRMLDELAGETFRRAERDWVRAEWSATLGWDPTRLGAGDRQGAPRELRVGLLHPIHLAQHDAYAATHEIMFAAGFGAVTLALCAGQRTALSAWLDACVAWCVASDRLDLLAEFLVCVCVLGLERSSAFLLGQRVLRSVWKTVGTIPSRGLPPTEDGADRAHALLLDAYHPTLVAGLLEAVSSAERVGRAPVLSTRAVQLTQSKAVSHSMEISGFVGWWARCTHPADHAALHVVADGLLTEAARRDRLDAVRQLVATSTSMTASVARCAMGVAEPDEMAAEQTPSSGEGATLAPPQLPSAWETSSAVSLSSREPC